MVGQGVTSNDSSLHNSADTEVVPILDQRIEVNASSHIQFAFCGSQDEIEDARSSPPRPNKHIIFPSSSLYPSP